MRSIKVSRKYRVTAVVSTGYSIEVNADSKEDAETIVEKNLFSCPNPYDNIDNEVDAWIDHVSSEELQSKPTDD